MSHVVGIDLGGSKIALGLVSPGDEILARRRIDTDADAGLQSVTKRIAVEVAALRGTLAPDEVLAAVGMERP
jgi:glucokinase